jgi:hypothetical protein
MKKGLCSAAVGFFAAAAFAAGGLPAMMMLGAWSFDLELLLKTPVFFFPIALAIVLVFGVPTFLLLRPFRPGHWSMPLVAGAILGLLLLLLLDLVLGGASTFLLMLLVVSLSALSALVFWFVWLSLSEREGACCAS